jgi:hypothetical protein
MSNKRRTTIRGGAGRGRDSWKTRYDRAELMKAVGVVALVLVANVIAVLLLA